MIRRLLWVSVGLAIVIAYPMLFSTPFQQRLGALVLLYAIAASAWNIVGGYAGQVSVGHVVFFGCGAYAAMGAYVHFGLSPLVGIPGGIAIAVALVIAIIKGSMVASVFMHLNNEQRWIYGALVLTVFFFIVLMCLPLFTTLDTIGTPIQAISTEHAGGH